MTDQPTWTVDGVTEPILWWFGPGDSAADLSIHAVYGVPDEEAAYAALVQHVRDAHRLHAALAVIRRLDQGWEDNDGEWVRYGFKSVAPRLVAERYAEPMTPDEAAVLALAANEGETPGCPRCGKVWIHGTCDDTVSRAALCARTSRARPGVDDRNPTKENPRALY